MKRLLLAFAIASAGVVSSASASSLVFDGTTLTGVTGLDVGGTFYDVTFVEGACDLLFAHCGASQAEFDFTNVADATAAGAALLSAIGTVAPEHIFGCTDSSLCIAGIPFGGGAAIVTYVAARNGASTDSLSASSRSAFGNSANESDFVWVDFGPAAAVPEPATLALLTLGAAGIGARRWRQRKA